MKNLKDKIQRIEQENILGLEKAETLSIREQQAIYNQRQYENLKFEKFKEIIKGQRYFRIQHLKDLGIKYNIAIHLSAKNVGKTTELYRCITDCLQRGKKFIYGRVTPMELETEVEKFREDKLSPVLLYRHGTRFYFFNKRDVENFMEENPEATPSYSTLLKNGCAVVGKGMTFMGANTLGSGNYEDYEMIFFDEIVSYTPKQYVNERILYNWGVAISTILRNKESLTVIMMGNLQNNITSVPILQYYGIDISDNLRVIERAMGDGEPCTILYVNSGSLYNNSLKNQAAVAHHASLDDRLFMEHNRIINSNVKVLSHAVVSDMDTVCACGVEYDDEFYALELRKHEEDDETFFALRVHPLTITTVLKTEIFTHDPIVSNRFSKTIYKKNMRPMYKMLFRLFENGVLYYSSANCMEIGSRCLDEIIDPYLVRTDPNYGR